MNLERKKPIKKFLPREQIVRDLTERFMSAFCRFKNKDYSHIERVVNRVLPIDYKVDMHTYLFRGVEHRIQNTIYTHLLRRFEGGAFRCRRGHA